MTIGPDLRVRAVSGLIMALCALGTDVLGGAWFILFWTFVFMAAAVEWQRMMGEKNVLRRSMLAGCAVFAAGFLAVGSLYWAAGLCCLTASVACWSLALPGTRAHAGIGVLYVGAPLVALLMLRQSDNLGMVALFFLFGIVWFADIAAYFSGRLLKGPKLWPRVSPNKTWSGFIGGTWGGGVAGICVIWAFGLPVHWPVFVLAMALAIISAGGDLFESALKRQFGVKDASSLIPGHGGVLDRIDGFMAVALVVGALMLIRGGDPAAALIVW